ncbi:MAG: DMT family transporter, partial [archaeon]
ALEGGKLSIAQPITYLWPFVTIALSVPFLGEIVGIGFLVGAALAAASIFLIAFPGRGSLGPDAKWGLFAMAFWGFAMFLTKPIVSEGGAFYPVIITRIVFFAIFFPYSRMFPEKEKKVSLPFGRMFLIGAFNSASFILYNLAVEKTGSSLPALVSALSPAVVAALSFLFLKERISAKQMVGIGLAVLGLVAVSLI